MSEKTLSFTLSEISNWQLDYENSSIELPAMQRGFVWKANQIESLWDSILRGFPIGSFLLSKSEDEKLFLLDGQQRATAIALGYYDPWCTGETENNNFWSLKNLPVVWIDLNPKEKTNTQIFVLRVVTQAHPWGYQRINHNTILSVSDRRNALAIFRENAANKFIGYIQLPPVNIFPYDADLPVPLSFIINSIVSDGKKWKTTLLQKCEEEMPSSLKTKHFGNDNKSYIEKIKYTIYNDEFTDSIFKAIKNLEQVEIPGIIIKKEILKAEDQQSGEDPTLFVRLNSSGTRIAGEELIYSIYKASFPEAKKLVENIGATFIPPSLVISLVSRIALSEINNDKYHSALNVNDFRKKIKDEDFKNNLKALIGDEENSPAGILFEQAFDLLLSKSDFEIPAVLVKNIIKGSPDLFLMLLQWLKVNSNPVTSETRRKILALITALSWFGRDNVKYVREIWNSIYLKDFWNKQVLNGPFFLKRNVIMYPLIQPALLREYLLHDVVEKKIRWNDLYPAANSEIINTYKQILNYEIEQETEITSEVNSIWDSFMNKLFSCKSLVLFAQRKYINESFGEFNQMETLEDSNTPWDWDHIYPASWVYAKKYIDLNTRHWTNSIGNFRAMSLEENRSENNSLSPKERLVNVKPQSFIKENDWIFWNKIEDRINSDNNEMVKNHLSAIIHRLCNIYEEWYCTLKVNELFN